MERTLTLAELEHHEVSLLEPRETLSWGTWSVYATNVAMAINAGSYQSTANAWATQTFYI